MSIMSPAGTNQQRFDLLCNHLWVLMILIPCRMALIRSKLWRELKVWTHSLNSLFFFFSFLTTKFFFNLTSQQQSNNYHRPQALFIHKVVLTNINLNAYIWKASLNCEQILTVCIFNTNWIIKYNEANFISEVNMLPVVMNTNQWSPTVDILISRWD